MHNEDMTDAKTIDYLGAKPHQDYVDWQLEKGDIQHLLKDLDIKTQIQVSTALPYEIEKIIKETDKISSFAIFEEDKDLFPSNVFSTNTIESIGSIEDIETLLKKSLPKTLSDLLHTLKEITKNQNDIKDQINKYIKT